MFLAYGVKVTYLKRISFGDFVLDEKLPRGSYRPLTEEEKSILKKVFKLSHFSFGYLGYVTVEVLAISNSYGIP